MSDPQLQEVSPGHKCTQAMLNGLSRLYTRVTIILKKRLHFTGGHWEQFEQVNGVM